ncbi:MAG: threonylcarbamoyl-AMP synthase [Deltaproteobacteria bacterium]|uniref:Threonylcarbamoyl-AMP synthase n=1 Tax=Candidatus Zymogenus saltonus TaxID=2844893 RepID=A0A9D8PLU7_9DELT|nr:threonylcarbamoyl-AMP synthase [Candidatus Zymogenus saltonus]
MQIFKINPDNPQKRLIKLVVESLEDGAVIAYPTDTIYGLGCDIYNKGALERLYKIKGKDPNKPMSFLCSGIKEISEYAQVGNQNFRILNNLVPGPYTFILEPSRTVPKLLLNKRKHVGIRVPDNNICRALTEELGRPIITTSVRNLENELFNDAEDIAERFKGQVDIVIDGGRIVPHHSTIIDLTGIEPLLIREGKGDSSFLMED